MSVEDNLSQDLAEARFRQLEVPHMRVHLDISDKEANTFDGWVELNITIKNPWVKLLLDCISHKVHRVQLNGQDMDFVHENHKVTIAADGLTGSHTLRVEFTNCYDKTGVGLHRYISPGSKHTYLYTDLEPFECHKVFPCFNQPDIKSVIELSVVGPADWEIASNCIPFESRLEDDKQHILFNPTKPLPAYLFALIAGEYKVIEDPKSRVPMKIYCRQSMLEYLDSEKLFEISRQTMDFYEEHFEIDYPFDKYDQVFVPEYTAGAMENAGLVVFTEDYLFRHKPTRSEQMNYYNTVVHEMAHMWYGNLITMKWWGDLWLKESVATFYGYYALTQASEFKESMLHFTQEVKGRALKADQYSSTHPIVTPCPDTNVAFQNFDSITYEKAASMIQQLIFIMGFEQFRKGLVALLKKYSYSNFDHNDFLDVMQDFAPISLKDWANKWLHTAHVNTLVLERNEEGQVYLKQGIQNPEFAEIRPHKLRLEAFQSDNMNKIDEQEVFIDDEKQLVFELKENQKDSFLFINQGDHAYARTYLDRETWLQLPEKLASFEEPLDRQVLLNCVFNMVEDSMLSPLDYLNEFATLFEKEASDSLKISIIENAILYYYAYLPQSMIRDMASTMIDLCLSQLDRKDLHYDVKSEWFRLYLIACDATADVSHLVNLIDNDSFRQLELDTKKKWSVLRKLAFHYHPQTEDCLSKMLKLDHSDAGKKDAHAVQCALRKDKLQLFEEVMSDEQNSADFLRAAMSSFFHRAQKKDCEPVVKVYFERLPEVFSDRDRIFSRSMSRVMFPSSFLKESLDFTVDLLPNVSNSSLKRSLLEHRDYLLKVEKIRNKFFTEGVS